MLSTALFPSAAEYCYARTETGSSALENYDALHPLEKTIVAHSVEKRKAEFGDTRWCAHQALKQLGVGTSEPILRGPRGMPLWPEGVTGSLTHTDGFRAAVVGLTSSMRSLGLDAEPAEPLPEGVLGSIARESEQPQLTRLADQGFSFSDRLLFCAKEATYKAWFPLTQRWLGFEQAEIDLREDGTFISYLLVRPTPVPFINGRWEYTDGFIVASAAVI